MLQKDSFQDAKVIVLECKTITLEKQIKENSISKAVFLLFYMRFRVSYFQYLLYRNILKTLTIYFIKKDN